MFFISAERESHFPLAWLLTCLWSRTMKVIPVNNWSPAAAQATLVRWGSPHSEETPNERHPIHQPTQHTRYFPLKVLWITIFIKISKSQWILATGNVQQTWLLTLIKNNSTLFFVILLSSSGVICIVCYLGNSIFCWVVGLEYLLIPPLYPQWIF